jgi:hypothetical protein
MLLSFDFHSKCFNFWIFYFHAYNMKNSIGG